MPAQPLSAEQKQDAKRLKVLWKDWQSLRREKGLPYSQEYAVSEDMGFGQSAFAQYVNGKIPLNPSAATKFAKLLGCKVEQFSPSIASQLAELASRTGAIGPGATDAGLGKGDLFYQPTDEDLDVFNDFLLLIGEDRQEAIDLIRRRAKQARAYSAPVLEKLTGKAKDRTREASNVLRHRASTPISARLRQRSLLGNLFNQDTEDDVT